MSIDELRHFYERIESYLTESLKEKKPSIQFQAEGPYPLLLMEVKHDVSAFAVVNSGPQKSYSLAYEHFKKLYSERHKEWADKYLSFVICRTERNRELDEFFGKIEHDVYFCRKYVIFLDEDLAELEREANKLPFIPIEPRTVPGMQRPLSAQTLLQRCGMVAKLAKYLIKPHIRGEDRIVDECLNGVITIGKPEKREVLIISTYPHGLGPNKRMKSLQINNFRAYKNQRFELDADLIILYGPNGFGKTSFFDALDFACTGRIGRFGPNTKNIAPHLDCKDLSRSRVELEVCDNGSKRICRTIRSWDKPSLNGKMIGRKELLLKLTNVVWEDVTARIDILERLFRSTYLFAQHEPELLSEYAKHCRLSKEIVARMLTFEDYVVGSDKIKKVIKCFTDRQKAISVDRKVLNLKIDATKKEVREFAKALKLRSAPERMKALAKEIADKVSEALDVRLPIISQIDKSEVRSWRAQIAGEIDSLQKKFELATTLESEHDFICRRRKEIPSEKEKLEDIRKKKRALINNISKSRKRQELVHNEIKSLNEEEERLSVILEDEKWREGAKTRLTLLLKIKTRLSERIGSVPKSVAALERKIDELSECQSKIDWLKRNLNPWTKNTAERKYLKDKLSLERKAVRGNQAKYKELSKQLRTKQIALVEIEASMKQCRQTESEVLSLLDKLESLITDSICPICGTDHKTKDKLLLKLKAQKEKRPAEVEAVVEAFWQDKKVCENLKRKIEVLETKIESSTQQEVQISRSLDDIIEQIHDFESKAREFNLPLKENLEDRIRIKRKEILQQLKLFADYAETLSDIQNLRVEARSREVQLDNDKEDSTKALDTVEVSLSKARETLRQKKNDLRVIEKQIVADSEQSKTFEDNIKEIENRLNSHIRLTSEYERNLKKIGLKSDMTADEINKIKVGLEHDLKKLNTVRSEVVKFETMLDTAEISARTELLNTDIKEYEDRSQRLKEKLDRIKDLKESFVEFRSILDETRDMSIRDYTKNYGPLSSVIQKRLRSVYGFGDITLTAKKGEIHVEVERKSSMLKPTDYFSDSQNQILMLSLFLSAAITQNWSSFAPVLLDDPVMHFDDLNAYAFVELIRSLIEDGKTNRQFIISTCEERLFGLMRQRFGNLGNRAIMYEFISIGDNGPSIKRLQ